MKDLTAGGYGIAIALCMAACSSNNASPDGGSGSPSGDGGVQSSDGAVGDAALIHVDRSHLADAGTSGTLDYSDPALWVCRPGIDKNECLTDLTATELLPDGGRQTISETRAADPKFDCFYVYPTVDLVTNGTMTDLSENGVKLVDDPLISQAARFSRICQIYAPLYRQVAFTPNALPGADAGSTMSDAGTSDASTPSPAGVLAFGDVRAAFHYYLDHFNNGRKFVILAHSQGSVLMTDVMQMDVDPVADVRSRLISALLIGGGTTVAPGQLINGTFKNIPLCSMPGQTGCMIAYSSFDVAAPPPANALFGKSPTGDEVACDNPSLLAGNSGPYRGTYFPIKINNPAFIPDNKPPADIKTPFVLYRNVLQGSCVKKNGYSYLEVTLLEQPGDPRGTPPYKNSASEALGFGLHVADYNIALDDLIDAVTQQAAAALH